MRMLLSSALILPVLLSLGCRDGSSPVGPQPPETSDPVQATAVSAEPLAVPGCAVFTVDVSDPTQVTVVETAEPECERVRPVLDGQPTLDPQNLVLHLPIALENDGPTPVEAPAVLRSSDNLLQVIAGEEGLLLFLNADSTEAAVADGAEVVRFFWRYDEAFPDPLLGAGERSDPRVIEIALDPTVQEFQVEMHGQAMIPAAWVVPMEAPDHKPAWFGDPAFSVPCEKVMTGECLINVVNLWFVEGATQAERQTAVEAVEGQVVGGRGVFIYFIRIPHDGTTLPLLESIQKLRALPQVDYAGAYGTDFPVPDYLRPYDGEGWRDWRLDPDSADGQNWALERVAAPMAWGCSFGDDDTRLAVIDRGFHDISALNRNLDQGASVGFGAYAGQDTIDHGTRVAALAVGHGNDSLHVTGMMWRAAAELQDFTILAESRDFEEVFRRVRRAGENNARVINISLGFRWDRDPSVELDTIQQRRDAERVAEWYRLLTEDLEALARQGRTPLIVFSAGNEAIDARWNPGRIAADSAPYRDQILVVGASDMSDGLASFSNHGPLVQVAAPGAGLWVLHGDSIVAPERPERVERPFTGTGTSFAAPLVTGTAGLLASFDPRLTASELKERIIEGANRGGRTAGGIPLLNAYEPLRATAERPGAPLCGQHVWASGGSLQVRRTPSSAGETLASVPNFVAQVEVLHGGKFISFMTLQGKQSLAWNSGSWGPGSLPADSAERRGGTHASVFGFSHDRDTVAAVDGSPVNNTRWYDTGASSQAPVWIQKLGETATQAGQIQVDNLPDPVQLTCIERDPDTGFCTLTIRETWAWLFRLGYPQFPHPELEGPHGPVTVSPLQVVVVDSAEWEPCGVHPSRECRRVDAVQDHVKALLYRKDLKPGGSTPVLLDTVPEETVFWIGEGETGEDMVLMRGRWDITLQAHADTFHTRGSPFFNFAQAVERCVIEYRRRADLSSTHPPITDLNACDFGTLDRPSAGAGGGTIAPSVVPAGTAGLDEGASEGAATVSLPFLKPSPAGPQETGG